MEPITTTVVAAIVAGAVAGAKNVATSAISDAYAALKTLITKKYESANPAVVAVEAAVEAKPDSNHERVALAGKLESLGAGRDAELNAMAQRLLNAIEELRGNERAETLFDFDRVRILTRGVELTDIEALGGVFRARDAEITDGFKATGIRQVGRSKKN